MDRRLVNMNILAPEAAITMSYNNQNGDSLAKGSNDFDYIYK
jgi:hypothetical protein